MFNISDDSRALPLTSKQAAFLGRLVSQHGKQRYQAAKAAAGIPANVTILRLTRWQASRLIAELTGGER